MKRFLALALLAACVNSVNVVDSFCDGGSPSACVIEFNYFEQPLERESGTFYFNSNSKYVALLPLDAIRERAEAVLDEDLEGVFSREPVFSVGRLSKNCEGGECRTIKFTSFNEKKVVAGETCYSVVDELEAENRLAVVSSPACQACFPDLAVQLGFAGVDDYVFYLHVPIDCAGLDTVFLVNGLSENSGVREAVREYAKSTWEKVKLVDYSSGYALSPFGEKEEAPPQCSLGSEAGATEIQGCVMALKNNYFDERGSMQLILVGDEAGVGGRSQGLIPSYPVTFLGDGGFISSVESDLLVNAADASEYEEVPSDRAFDADWLKDLRANSFSGGYLIVSRIPFDPAVEHVGSEKMLESVYQGARSFSVESKLFLSDTCGGTDSVCHIRKVSEFFEDRLFDEDALVFSPDYCEGYYGLEDYCSNSEALVSLFGSKDVLFLSAHGTGSAVMAVSADNPAEGIYETLTGEKITVTYNNAVQVIGTDYGALLNPRTDKNVPPLSIMLSCYSTSLDEKTTGKAFKEEGEISVFEGGEYVGKRNTITDSSMARAFLRRGGVTLVGFTRSFLTQMLVLPDSGREWFGAPLFTEKIAFAAENDVSIGEALYEVTFDDLRETSFVEGCVSKLGDEHSEWCEETIYSVPHAAWMELNLRILGMPNARLTS